MNAFFRHMAIRLWVTALAGGLICTVLLPPWQHSMGLSGLWMPISAIIIGCFALCGFVMNRLGLAFIRGQIAEAAVWERAGMSAEAEDAFERAKAVYDGFWLSPLQRRRSADWVMLRLARFCIAQPAIGNAGRTIVLAYLERHPEDEAVALGWLERVLRQDEHTRSEHEAAARINDALQNNEKIQRLLMQLYLNNGRSDFEATQTYRRVWQWADDLPDPVVRKLARLLANENCLNDWALQVYLKGYETGDSRFLEDLAASIRYLLPDPDNRDDLAQAKRIIGGLDEARRTKLFQRFAPTEAVADDDIEAAPEPSRPQTPDLKRRIAALWIGGGHRLAALFVQVRTVRQRLRMPHRLRRRFATALLSRLMAWGVGVGALVLLVMIGWHLIGRKPEPPHPVVHQAQQTHMQVSDPFTIQVAAYLKSEDAQAFVDRLKQQNIAAFWTKATSGSRTWYQVKVSHFSTKDEARKYGEALKSRGVIEDFYVANYTH